MDDVTTWQRADSIDEASRLICPSCKATTQDGWRYCRHCNNPLDEVLPLTRVNKNNFSKDKNIIVFDDDANPETLEDIPESFQMAAQRSSQMDEQEDTWEKCPSCGAKVSPDWSFCRSCNAALDAREIVQTHTHTPTGEATNTSGDSDTGQSANSGLLETINELLDTGDDLRAQAQDKLGTGNYDRALATYDEAQEVYEDALEMARESELIDTAKIEQRLTAVDEQRQEIHQQQLQDEVESVRSTLSDADSLAGDDELERVQQRLTDFGSRLTSAMETAEQHGFEGLQDKIATLEERRQKRLTEVSERLQSDPVPDDIPGAPIISVNYDDFTDREPIGGGGNADVMKAKLSTSDGDVELAVKEPRMSGTLHTKQVKRMLEEAETWDRLDDHDHIVGVVDYGSEPLPWIAMEYMDGGHLGEWSGELDTPQALWTALAITEGVYHAHRRGIAHLDLKPQNVLLRTVDHAWDVPKVADWGLSKHLLEHSKSVEGMSVEYAAPEQFDDSYGQTDDITDIYQLGAVFYELFTGHPPFEGQPFKLIDMVKSARPTPPSEISDVPDALDEILLTALAKEKDDRYDDVVYLRDALQEMYEEW